MKLYETEWGLHINIFLIQCSIIIIKLSVGVGHVTHAHMLKSAVLAKQMVLKLFKAFKNAWQVMYTIAEKCNLSDYL